MPRPLHLRRALLTSCAVLSALIVVAWVFSAHHNLSYAGKFGFLVLSDGYVVVPWPDGEPRAWGDWGWWIERPWGWEEGTRSFVVPLPDVSPVRQIGARGLHVPLWMALEAAVIWPVLAAARGLLPGRRRRAWQSLWIALWLTLGLAFWGGGAWNVACVGWAIMAGWLVVVEVARRDRPRSYPPGICKECGYDPTGNVSGICPECGVRLTAEDKAAIQSAAQQRSPRR